MMTIYEKTTGALVKTGDRSITSFPSGLLRVDQLYVGKSGEEATHRSILAYELQIPDQSDLPDIDGSFIFPEVQESKDGTGFTKYQCSAYGRTTSQYRELSRSRNTIKLLARTGILTRQIEVTVYNMIGTVVKKNGEVVEPSEIELPSDFLQPISAKFITEPLVVIDSITEIAVSEATRFNPAIRTYSANYPAPEGFPVNTLTFNLEDPFIQTTAQRNFGKFVEYEFSANRIKQDPPQIE